MLICLTSLKRSIRSFLGDSPLHACLIILLYKVAWGWIATVAQRVLCLCCSSGPACRRRASPAASLLAQASLVAHPRGHSLRAPSSLPAASLLPSSDSRTMAQPRLQVAHAHLQRCSQHAVCIAQHKDWCVHSHCTVHSVLIELMCG